jgi:membrane protease subunit HflK
MNNFESRNVKLETTALNPGLNALLKLVHYLFVLLSFGIIIMVLWYFSLGGAFTVEEQERVLIMNFGELSETVYTPGWHWNWPAPISEIVRIPVSRKTLISNAFWYWDSSALSGDKKNKSLSEKLVPGRDGYLFTGDTNIIHVGFGIFYHISDPYKYYTKCVSPEDPRLDDFEYLNENNDNLGTRGPQTQLKALLENAVIKATSKETVDDVLAPSYRKNIENAIKLAVGQADLGITVDEVWYNKTRTPPLGAVQAFLDVFDANNFKYSRIEEAKSYAVKTINQAESESVRISADAQAYKTEVVANIKADVDYFKAMLKEYKKNPDIVLVSRYSEVLGEVLDKATNKFIIRNNQSGHQELRLKLNPEPPKKKKIRKNQ